MYAADSPTGSSASAERIPHSRALRQKENAPNDMIVTTMSAPGIARMEPALQAYFAVQEGMQAERIPKEMSGKLSGLVGGVRGGGTPPQRGRIAESVLY